MAGFLINSRGTTLMIDPLLGGFDMPIMIEMPVATADVPHLDAVLVTHSDNDHVLAPGEAFTLAARNQSGTSYSPVCVLGTGVRFLRVTACRLRGTPPSTRRPRRTGRNTSVCLNLR